MASPRIERVNDLLLSFLGQRVSVMRDPRLQTVTITGVSVTPDLKRAKVYWTSHNQKPSSEGDVELVFPSKDEIREINEALKGAEGYLKKSISSELELRNTPQLVFKYDSSLAEGEKVDRLLSQISGNKE